MRRRAGRARRGLKLQVWHRCGAVHEPGLAMARLVRVMEAAMLMEAVRDFGRRWIVGER